MMLRLPGPGAVQVTGTAKPRRGKAIRLPRQTANISAGGTRRITVRLNSRVKRALRRSRLRVTLRITYTPTGGTARTIQRVVTLKATRGRS
jgi:hypothetical protein